MAGQTLNVTKEGRAHQTGGKQAFREEVYGSKTSYRSSLALPIFAFKLRGGDDGLRAEFSARPGKTRVIPRLSCASEYEASVYHAQRPLCGFWF